MTIFLPKTMDKSMEHHTYAIMDRVEEDHWWFVGRRAILRMFMVGIVSSLSSKSQVPSSKSRDDGSKFKFQGSESVGSEAAEPTDQLDKTNIEPRILNSEQALRILDVGCGTGANLEMLLEFGLAEGVDVSEQALESCRSKGLNVHKGLAEKLPFEDGEFDIVTALDVVEHLDDDVAGLSEMQRVLRKGGRALVFVPAFMWLWGVQDDVSNHRIRYTKQQIVERLASAGFEVKRATYANIAFFAPILAGRTLMRLTGFKPESENNVNIPALNGILGSLFSAERYWLKRANIPFGVSIIAVAEKN